MAQARSSREGIISSGLESSNTYTTVYSAFLIELVKESAPPIDDAMWRLLDCLRNGELI